MLMLEISSRFAQGRNKNVLNVYCKHNDAAADRLLAY